VYDAGKENVAFLKEPVVLDKNISGLNLTLYPSQKAVKYVEMKEAPGGILMTFEGNPQTVNVLSLNEKLQDYKVTHKPKSDSVHIWFDAEKQDVGISASENLRFSYDDGLKKDSVSLFYRYNTRNELTLSNNKGNLLAPGDGFTISSNYIIDSIQPEKWTLVSDSLSQPFTARINENNRFGVNIQSEFKEGKKYSLTVPRESLSSFYVSVPKSYRFDFEADKTENYGSLVLTLDNIPENTFWLQLLTDNNKIAYSSTGKTAVFTFNALKPGRYKARILVDNNENGIWDSADLLTDEFAEDVYILNKTIEIRPLWEIRETWDLKAAEDKPGLQSSGETTSTPVIP
jgi:hypothetical protein